jgi:hypothetical protein
MAYHPEPLRRSVSGFHGQLVYFRGISIDIAAPGPTEPEPHAPRRFSPNVAILGYVSMLTAMSSAMIYGLLPVFLVKALGVSIASVGLI